MTNDVFFFSFFNTNLVPSLLSQFGNRGSKWLMALVSRSGTANVQDLRESFAKSTCPLGQQPRVLFEVNSKHIDTLVMSLPPYCFK